MSALYPVAFILASALLAAADPAPAAAQSAGSSPIELAQARSPYCNPIFARQKALRTNCPETRNAVRSRSVERRRPRSYAGSHGWGYSGGSYRTICVRVCDGYYYTLSTTSSRRRFQQDAEKCAGQYPPGKALLFYHPFPYGDVERAVSLSGERYGDQDYAFAFRTEFRPACAAELHEGLAGLKARVYAAVPMLLGGQAATARRPGPAVPVPTALRDPSSDPETLANRTGGLVPTPVAAPGETATMRTVGDPSYFDVASEGPPPTVPGYEPPELKDFRVPLRASLPQAIN